MSFLNKNRGLSAVLPQSQYSASASPHVDDDSADESAEEEAALKKR